MNIKDFDKKVSEVLLERGYTYYQEGSILSYSKEGNIYVFEIIGSDDYTVQVEVDENLEIVNSRCNCPYTYGFTCKHEVAGYYLIKERELGEEGETSLEQSNAIEHTIIESNNKEDEYSKYRKIIKEEFVNKPKEELVDFIMNIIDKKRSLAEPYIIKIKEQEVKNMPKNKLYAEALEEIEEILERYKDYGEEYYTDYDYYGEYYSYDCDYDVESAVDIDDMSKEIKILFERLGDNLDIVTTIELIVRLCLGLIELNDETEYTDYNDVWQDTVDILAGKLEETYALSTEERLIVFKNLLKLNPEVVQEYEMDLDIRLLIRFSDIPEAKNILLKRLTFEKNNSGWYFEEKNNKTAKIIYDVHEKAGTKSELAKVITKYLQYDSIRTILVEKLLKKRDFTAIVNVTKEWQDGKDREKWLKVQLEAYKELKDEVGQKEVLEKLIILGKLENYSLLKELYGDDFSSYYPLLLEKIKENSEGEVWGEVAAEENDADELMRYLKKYPEEIVCYVSKVCDAYPNEAEQMYKDYILELAAPVGDKHHYRTVVSYVVKYKNIFGLAKGEELVLYLDTTYKRRRLFRAELKEALRGFK